ncbi:HEC/Ndc80p family-domain-containing protein [Pilobolus umbonatus]|nr:HEC/Ndc80p family-domain-containing protein [Pilobolus umbonatus]
MVPPGTPDNRRTTLLSSSKRPLQEPFTPGRKVPRTTLGFEDQDLIESIAPQQTLPHTAHTFTTVFPNDRDPPLIDLPQSETRREFSESERQNDEFISLDPLMIEKKEEQRAVMRFILQYLTESGYEHVPRTLRPLSTKDFQLIVKYLTRIILPTYTFKSSFEDRFISVLKMIQCPFARTVTAKSLITVGTPHLFPTFLGLMNWLVESCKYRKYLSEKTPYHIEDNDTQSLAELLDKNNLDRLIYEFYTLSYEDFMEKSDMNRHAIDDLHVKFVDKIQRARKYDGRLKESNSKLEQQLNEINDEIATIMDQDDTIKQNMMDTDIHISKIQKHLDGFKKKFDYYAGMLGRIASEKTKIGLGIKRIKKKKEAYAAHLEQSHISEEELITLIDEDFNSDERLKALEEQLRECQANIAGKLKIIQRMKDEIHLKASQYNTLVASFFPDSQNEYLLQVNTYTNDPKTMLSIDLLTRVIPILKEKEIELEHTKTNLQEKAGLAADDLSGTQKQLTEKRVAYNKIMANVESIRKQVESTIKAADEENEIYNLNIEVNRQRRQTRLKDAQKRTIDAQNMGAKYKSELVELNLVVEGYIKKVKHDSRVVSDLGHIMEETQAIISERLDELTEMYENFFK